jgi:hypothetical protein
MNYRMTLPEFLCLCQSLGKHGNGTLYEYAFLLELELYRFISKHVMIALNASELYVNNVRYSDSDKTYVAEHMTFVAVGDIIEVKGNAGSFFVEVYILLFNIINFCKLRFFINKM